MDRSPVRFDNLKLVLATLFVLGGSIAVFPPAFYEFFAREPGLVFAGAMSAFVAYLPSLWVTRRIDQRPFGLSVYAFSILLVMAMSPVTSHVTTLLIRQGFRLWQVVGVVEEASKMLPVILFAVLAPSLMKNRRDGVVIGALAGLGFAIIEFAVGFALDNFPEHGWADLLMTLPGRWAFGTNTHILWAATTGGAIGYLSEGPRTGRRIGVAIGIVLIVMLTHNAQDFIGKFIAPVSIGVIANGLMALGVPETAFAQAHPMFALLLASGAVVNTLLINVLVLPILGWLVTSSKMAGNAREDWHAA